MSMDREWSGEWSLLMAVFTIDIPCLERLRSTVSLKSMGTQIPLLSIDVCACVCDCESKLCSLFMSPCPLRVPGTANMLLPGLIIGWSWTLTTAVLLLDNERKLGADTTCGLHLCPSSGFNCGFSFFLSRAREGFWRREGEWIWELKDDLHTNFGNAEPVAQTNAQHVYLHSSLLCNGSL